MAAPERPIVLASRSPQRLDLLAKIVRKELIRVLPPASSEEAGFEGLRSLADIEARLMQIARTKCADVQCQLAGETADSCVIAADTVVVVGEQDNDLKVLGQPPLPDWRETTRDWFLSHYFGRTHRVLTGLIVAKKSATFERLVSTRVTFRDDAQEMLEWYLDTQEPLGKAGGYAIQSAGHLFVERIEGSLSNVIGLPLRELLEVLQENSRPAE